MTSIDNHSLRIIDPSFDKSNFRAEFKLPTDTVLLSNFRLINVGISSNQADSYSPTLGTQGAIRSISLYDGAELLDQVRDFNTYSSWKNLNKSNDSNISANRHLNQVGLGFVQSGDATYTDPNLDQIGTLDTQNPVANNLTKKGWISLQNCLSFLRASVVVPTSLFRQLRVVVEYKNAEALKNAVRDRRDGTLSTDTGTALLCEEVDDGAVRAEMMRQYQGVVYHPYEFDTVRLPEPAGLANTNDATKRITQRTSNLVHGFNNKKLKRLLLVHKPTNNANWVNGNVNNGYANNGSQALLAESTQIRINGVNKIAGNGVEGKNRRLAMTTDTYGDVNMFAGQQFVNLGKFNDNVAGANTLQKTQGSVDFLGLVVEEYINTLQVFVNRDGVFGNNTINQPIDLVLMGEVEKAVVVGNNGYKIVYTQ